MAVQKLSILRTRIKQEVIFAFREQKYNQKKYINNLERVNTERATRMMKINSSEKVTTSKFD